MSNYILRDAKMKYDYPVIMDGKDNGYYQKLDFDVSALPEIASWQVGKEYTLIIKVRETRHELLKSEDKGVKEKACFEVLEVGAYTDYNTENRDKVREKLK